MAKRPRRRMKPPGRLFCFSVKSSYSSMSPLSISYKGPSSIYIAASRYTRASTHHLKALSSDSNTRIPSSEVAFNAELPAKAVPARATRNTTVANFKQLLCIAKSPCFGPDFTACLLVEEHFHSSGFNENSSIIYSHSHTIYRESLSTLNKRPR